MPRISAWPRESVLDVWPVSVIATVAEETGDPVAPSQTLTSTVALTWGASAEGRETKRVRERRSLGRRRSGRIEKGRLQC